MGPITMLGLILRASCTHNLLINCSTDDLS